MCKKKKSIADVNYIVIRADEALQQNEHVELNYTYTCVCV